MLERVLSYVRKHGLMRPGDRVGVAVSGGADSVALLRLLLESRTELGIVLSAVHFNHKIRGAEAEADEQFVSELARGYGLEFRCDSADTPSYASEHKMSLEAAGRKLRYAFFDRLTAGSVIDRIATAHTRDDQTETVLMRFLRGSGTKGLAGIFPLLKRYPGGRIAVPGEALAAVVRPLLEVSREELRAYLRAHKQAWREDASNADTGFTRNRLRHQILPLLRQLNPNLDEVLSETADIAREEERWWTEQANRILPNLLTGPKNVQPGSPGPQELSVDSLLAEPLAMQRRLVRTFTEAHGVQLDFRHVEEVLAIAGEPGQAERHVELPQGWEAVRRGRELWLRRSCLSNQEHGYDIPLPVPGAVVVGGRKFRAALGCVSDLLDPENRSLAAPGVTSRHGAPVRSALLAAGLANGGLRVRSWRAGDRYWPAHTRQPKKLKELLQAPHVPREQKPHWPVVVNGEDIVWVPGFAAPERFQVREGDSDTLVLEEMPLPDRG